MASEVGSVCSQRRHHIPSDQRPRVCGGGRHHHTLFVTLFEREKAGCPRITYCTVLTGWVCTCRTDAGDVKSIKSSLAAICWNVVLAIAFFIFFCKKYSFSKKTKNKQEQNKQKCTDICICQYIFYQLFYFRPRLANHIVSKSRVFYLLVVLFQPLAIIIKQCWKYLFQICKSFFLHWLIEGSTKFYWNCVRMKNIIRLRDDDVSHCRSNWVMIFTSAHK